MTKYDDLFDQTAPEGSVFTDKGLLNPLTEPKEIIARDEQEREFATILNGVHDRYLPPTVSIYGPPGVGKTITTRRLCKEFAARHEIIAVEYVNLKECRTLFSVANEILFELTGAKKQAYEGLDGEQMMQYRPTPASHRDRFEPRTRGRWLLLDERDRRIRV